MNSTPRPLGSKPPPVKDDSFLPMLTKAARSGRAATSDFDLNPDVSLPPDRTLRDAAVLIPFQRIEGEWRLWLTRRSSKLKHHPGQIAFPGGKRDAGDATIEATGLREAEEEMRLPSNSVEILGHLPSHETVTGFQVTPLVARVTKSFDPVPEPGEVAEVFHVPAQHVLTDENYFIEGRRWQGHLRRYYVVPYGPYYIWGATARMLRALSAACDA